VGCFEHTWDVLSVNVWDILSVICGVYFPIYKALLKAKLCAGVIGVLTIKTWGVLTVRTWDVFLQSMCGMS